mmetsp:Transcript_11117/g.25637  ORF Transcript_11117/g.25637 Transcript_11117/m.25637 type:complete len:321 (+) Transcript_11117:281-1243(+)
MESVSLYHGIVGGMCACAMPCRHVFARAREGASRAPTMLLQHMPRGICPPGVSAFWLPFSRRVFHSVRDETCSVLRLREGAPKPRYSSSSATRNQGHLERDLQPILAIDEQTARGHAQPAHLIQHAHGAHACLDSTLFVPNLLELGSHLGAVESWMENADGDAILLELLRHEDSRNVASRAAHVVTIQAALVLVLRLAPLGGASLARDDHRLGAGLEFAGLVQLRCDQEWPHRAAPDLAHRCLDIDVGDWVHMVWEEARIVDHNINRSVERLCHLCDPSLVSHIDALDDLRHSEGVELRRALAADHDHLRSISDELLHRR